MYKKISSHITSFRFRRWSRASYAIFRSLSCSVTIGKVCSSICDMSLRKSGKLHQEYIFRTLNKEESDGDENSPDELQIKQNSLEQTLNIQLIQQLAVVAVVSVFYLLIYYNLAVGVG